MLFLVFFLTLKQILKSNITNTVYGNKSYLISSYIYMNKRCLILPDFLLKFWEVIGSVFSKMTTNANFLVIMAPRSMRINIENFRHVNTLYTHLNWI